MINLNDLTLGQLKELLTMASRMNLTAQQQTESLILKPGATVFIRTITWHYTGRVSEVTAKEIKLMDAAWIADSRRLYNHLKDGIQDGAEVEPFPEGVVINRDTVVDVAEWTHALPMRQL